MNIIKLGMTVVIAVFFCCIPTNLEAKPIDNVKKSWFFKSKKKIREPEVKVKSEFEKIVSDSSNINKGLFSVVKKGGDYYFEIPASTIGRDLLVVNKLQRVPKELNEAGVNRGVNYENQMIRLEWDKKGSKLSIRQQRPLPLSSTEDAIYKSVENNFISPLIATLKVEAVKDDSTSVLVKVNELFEED